MKILMVSHEYPPIGGGGANACMFLASEYAKQGHDVVILTVWYDGEEEFCRIMPVNDCTEDGIKSGVIEIYRVKSRRKYMDHCSFAEMFDYLLKAFPLAGNIAKNEKIGICQVFFGIPSGPIGLYLKKKYRIPYVIRFGGGDIPGFQKRFKAVYKVLAPFIKCIWNNADALIANSAGLKKLALEFSPKSDIQIIHNGVDVEKYIPSNSNVSDNIYNEEIDCSIQELDSQNVDEKTSTIRLLFVSRLIERKGLHYLIPHLDELQEKVAPHKLNLTIVGDGPYRTVLEELAKNISTEVVFEGQKQKEELLAYYQNADVFVFPSCKEGMPNVVLEAMACGLPIVMNNCEGSEELVMSKTPESDENTSTSDSYGKPINGMISQGQDGFWNKLHEFLLLPKYERKQMGINSRKRVNELFAWKRMAEIYLTLFDNIIG